MLGVTSGTTGEPKLAMLTHLNFISGGVCQKELKYNFTIHDVYLSYVPLTHVYEQIMHFNCVIHSFRVGYNTGNIQQNLISDIQYLKPTLFGSFPAFYAKIYKKLNEKVENQFSIIQTLIDSIIQQKIYTFLKTGVYKHQFYDVLFTQIRKLLGGRVRFFVSGGAPLSPEIKNVLTVVFSAPIFEAYGCTESAGCITCTEETDVLGNNVGGILPCCKMQLRDVPELGLFTNAKIPMGLVYIKGNSVFKGFFKNPKLTAERLDADGWLSTGDVGSLNPNGSISIIDRLSEIKKLQHGQFISPQKLENKYEHAPLIEQICIDINQNSNYLTAIVHLNSEKLNQFASVNGLNLSYEKLLKTEDVEYAVLK